jgi:hypothetical protein
MPTIGIPGAMVAFVGRKDTRVIDRLREALADPAGQPDNVRSAIEGITGGVGTDNLATKIIRQPVFADIMYGGEVLNRGVFVPEGSPLTLAVFPYNGGRLAADGFSLAEYYTPDCSVALDAVVVQVSPDLTAAEEAALRKVPDHQSVRNVGAAAWCDSTWWAVAGFVVSATYAVICTILAAKGQPRAISEEELARLDPESSAEELLALRREFILTGLRQP